MFSQELRKKREKAGLTLRAAAKATRGALSYPMLYRYEVGMGLEGMSLRHARALSRLYEWDLDDINKKIARQVKAGRKAKEKANEVSV